MTDHEQTYKRLTDRQAEVDELRRAYERVVVAANNNAEKLDAMTALAEKYREQRDILLKRMKATIFSLKYITYGKHLYVDDIGLMEETIASIQEEGR